MRRLAQQKELVSLIGHFKLPKNQSVFSQRTVAYLEDIDLVRLLHLNKQFRATLLKHNPRVFTSMVYCARINRMHNRLDEWQERTEELQRAVTLFEAKDKARN